MTKERPILFSAPMVRAILDGSKTQTRRVMKHQPHDEWYPAHYTELHAFDKDGELNPDKVVGWGAVNEDGDQGYVCPYGQPGDRLWVREACADIGPRLTYRADTDDGVHCMVKRWTPSIHMPRSWSRILLEIVSVRVERLQEISDSDAYDEGTQQWASEVQKNGNKFSSIRTAWQGLWTAVNGAESWESNPWVWCISFRRVE